MEPPEQYLVLSHFSLAIPKEGDGIIADIL